jgi:hypothetical protein
MNNTQERVFEFPAAFEVILEGSFINRKDANVDFFHNLVKFWSRLMLFIHSGCIGVFLQMLEETDNRIGKEALQLSRAKIRA